MIMKKAAFLIAALVGFSAMAQDTLHLTRPLDKYFAYNWIQIDTSRDERSDSVYVFRSGFGCGACAKYNAFYVYTDEPLTVYGLAVSTQQSDPPEAPAEDSSVFYELFYIWEANDGFLDPLDSFRLCPLVEAPDYYVDYGFRSCWGLITGETPTPFPPYPMYERYFDHPVHVADSFYVGIGDHTAHQYVGFDDRNVPVNGVVDCAAVSDDGATWRLKYTLYWDSTEGWHPCEEKYYKWMYYDNWELHPFLYPILTPADTADTNAAIGGATLEERLVAVRPNPAQDRAEVLCSYGLRRIEIVDAAGRMMQTLEASGYRAVLDTSRWPRGTYLLRIHSANGKTTTRKLVVE